MIRDYFRLALNSFRTRQKRTWLTMIGIFIGIAAVVALVSLGQGMEHAVLSEFSKIGADKIFIQSRGSELSVPGSLASSKITDADVRRTERTVGIKEAAGRLIKSLNIEYNKRLQTQMGLSLPQDSSADMVIQASSYTVAQGRMLRPSDKGKVLVGSDFANDILFGKAAQTGSKILLNGQEFEIAGILKAMGDPGVDKGVTINEDDFRAIVPEFGEDEYSMIYAQTAPNEDPEAIAESLKKSLRRSRGEKEGEETFTVQTATELINSFLSILAIVQLVLIGIAGISLVVGGIGIMNTMYTSVLERTREIGVMKSIGARNSDILLLFLIESGLLGLMGGAIGVTIGFSMSKIVEIGARAAFGTTLIEAYFPWYLIIGALSFSFIIGTLSGILPARQASKMTPVDALRYD